MGLYAESDQMLTIEQLAPFLQRIEKSMSRHPARPVQIDLYLYLKRETVEEDFQKGLIDIIRIGEGPLVRLRRLDPAITPLVQQVSGGKTSAIFVARSSPITNLTGLNGTKFCAGNPTSSSSGYRLIDQLRLAGLRYTKGICETPAQFLLANHACVESSFRHQVEIVFSVAFIFKVLEIRVPQPG